jgi:hypothetical protein
MVYGLLYIICIEKQTNTAAVQRNAKKKKEEEEDLGLEEVMGCRVLS